MRAGTADTELIRAAVTLASRAPSLHNTQPWLWVAHDDALHLHLDRSRIVRNTDTGGREAVIACGAMLDHLVTAMAVANWSAEVDRFPDPDDGAHLATVAFTPTAEVTAVQRRRADAILRRRTDRLPFLAPTDPRALETALRAAIGPGPTVLDVLADELRTELAESSERLQKHEMALQRLTIELTHVVEGVRERFRGLEIARIIGDYHKRKLVDAAHRARMDAEKGDDRRCREALAKFLGLRPTCPVESLLDVLESHQRSDATELLRALDEIRRIAGRYAGVTI